MQKRIRTLKPETWGDENVGRLSHGARLLRIGFITMSDDEGRFRALTSEIVGHIFPYEAEEATPKVPSWIAEIRKTGSVLFYKDRTIPYGAFRYWAKHQRINKPSPSELPSPPEARVMFENGLVEVQAGSGLVWKQRVVADPASLQEDSRNVPGAFQEDSSATRTRVRRSDPDPLVVHLSNHLAERVRANEPKAKVSPESDKWLTDIRLLVADRGGDAAAVKEIEQVIDWSQADEFWRANILSPGKLRVQFSKLLLNSQKTKPSVSGRQEPRVETTAEILARRGAPA